jgi:hypothetical protein
MTEPVLSFIQSKLDPDESILWSGEPKAGLLLRPTDALQIPFSLLWGGFAFYWEYMVLRTAKGPLLFKLWGIPFVLMGLYLIAGRFVVDAAYRSHTYYFVTNRRVLILSTLFKVGIRSLDLRTMPDLTLEQKQDGTGTILFGPREATQWAAGFWPGSTRRTAAFEMISRANDVYETIRRARREM